MCEWPQAELARRDRLLEALGLCPNSELVEGKPLSDGERRLLASVRSRLEAAELAELDDYWLRRLVRAQHASEGALAASLVRVARFRREVRSAARSAASATRLREFTTQCIRSVVGGEDLYGHVVWVEQLVDLRSAAQAGLRDEMLLARGRLTEGIESRKRAVAARLGVVRYKQVYVLDLAPVSVGSLMTSTHARAAVEDIMAFGALYYPEGTFKIFIVNAPLVFRSAFAILSPLISPTTLVKIKIIGSDFLPALAAEGVPIEAVPAILGGTHPGCDVIDLVLPPETKGFSETDEDDIDQDGRARPPPPPRSDAHDEDDGDLSPTTSVCGADSAVIGAFFTFATCGVAPRRHRARRRRRRSKSISSSGEPRSCFGAPEPPSWDGSGAMTGPLSRRPLRK